MLHRQNVPGWAAESADFGADTDRDRPRQPIGVIEF